MLGEDYIRDLGSRESDLSRCWADSLLLLMWTDRCRVWCALCVEDYFHVGKS